MYQNLRVSRQEKKKTQSEIAELLHITKQQYQLYESGKREMPMHHFMVIARFYNVSLDYLAGLIDEPKALYCP